MPHKNLEQALHEAQKELSNLGVDVRKPTSISTTDRRFSGPNAYYSPVTDTIVVNITSMIFDINDILVHELLHKWQYDIGRDFSTYHSRIEMIHENWEFVNELIPLRLSNSPASKSQEAKFKENLEKICFCVVFRKEIETELEEINQELDKIEMKAEKLTEEMRAKNIDPDDGDKRSRSYMEKLSGLRKKRSALRNKRKNLIEKMFKSMDVSDEEKLDEFTNPIKERVEVVEDRRELVTSLGEAMSYFHSTRPMIDPNEKDSLEGPFRIIEDTIEHDETGYDDDLLPIFKSLSNRYLERCEKGLAEEEAFQKTFRDAKKIYLSNIN